MPKRKVLMRFRALGTAASILGLLLAMTTEAAHAANVYVRQGASGANNGTDWTNALTDLPASPVRGNTYYVADGNYAGRTFNTPASGTSAITIKKATIADHGTDTGWNTTFGDGQAFFSGAVTFTTSHWVWDGQIRNTDWRSGYGFKICCSDGMQFGIPFSVSVTNITVRYTEMQGSGDLTGTIFDRGVRTGLGNSNITISRSYIHDFGETLIHVFRNANVLIEYTWLARNGATFGVHSEGIVFTEGVTNVTVRHNVFEDIGSTAYIGTPTGGHPGCSGSVNSNWYIYGNVFTGGAKTRSLSPNGILIVFDHQHTGDFVFSNNLIVGVDFGNVGNSVGGGGDGCMQSFTAQNNLFVGVGSGGLVSANVGSPNVSHNAFWSSPNSISGANAFVTTGNPLGANFSLTSTAAATMPAGLALSTPYNIDLNGIDRGSDGKWDRGAVEFGGSTNSTLPAPPTGLALQ